jgi:hypothetical protein
MDKCQERIRKGKPCPDNKICNPKSGRCVSKSGRIGKSLLNKSKRRSKSIRRSVRRSVKRSSKKRSARRSDIPDVVTHQGKKYYKKDSILTLKKVNGKNVWFRVWMEPLDKYRSRQRSRSRSQKLKRKVLHEVRVPTPVLKSKSKKDRISLVMTMMALSNEDYLDQVIENPRIIYSSPAVLNLWKSKKAGWLPYFKKNQTIPLKDKIILADLLTGGVVVDGVKFLDGFSKFKNALNNYVNRKYGNKNVPKRGTINFAEDSLDDNREHKSEWIFRKGSKADLWARNFRAKILKLLSLITKDQKIATEKRWDRKDDHVLRLANVIPKLTGARKDESLKVRPKGKKWVSKFLWQNTLGIWRQAIELRTKGWEVEGLPINVSKKGVLRMPKKYSKSAIRFLKSFGRYLRRSWKHTDNVGNPLIVYYDKKPYLNTSDIDAYKYEDLINEILVKYY